MQKDLSFLKNYTNYINENQPIAFIDLSAIKYNATAVKKRVKGKLCAVVKSDAYGHGIVECARALQGVADYFAVATLKEAVKLKTAGIVEPILCLLPIKDVERAIFYGVEFAVHTVEYAQNVSKISQRIGICATIHIAVNTGMNRLGIDSLEQLKQIIGLSNVKIAGVFSHFYNGANIFACNEQTAKFINFARIIKSNFPCAIRHIGSSASLAFGSEFSFDMVRIGLALYGYLNWEVNLKLRPVMQVFAPVLQSRNLLKGENLLYGGYKIKSDECVSICAHGYANGFRKGLKSGLNNACMNLCAVSGEYDFVSVMLDAQLEANRLNTIPYEVLTSYGLKCERIYWFGEENESNRR